MNNAAIVKRVAVDFVERAEALGLKGKKRDDAALDYFLGAAAIARAQDNKPLENHIGRVALLVIATRGFKGVQDIVSNPITAKDAAASEAA